jgi:hypothetical protein
VIGYTVVIFVGLGVSLLETGYVLGPIAEEERSDLAADETAA